MPTQTQSWERYLTGLRRVGMSPGVWWVRDYLDRIKTPSPPTEVTEGDFFSRLMQEYPGRPEPGTSVKGRLVERVG